MDSVSAGRNPGPRARNAWAIVLLAVSLVALLGNLRFDRLYSLDNDTVDAFVLLEDGPSAYFRYHPAFILGYFPYSFLKSQGVSRFEALRINFAVAAAAAVAAYFLFSYSLTGSALRAAAVTLLFSLMPAVQFVERYLDDNFLSYGFLFLLLAGLLVPGAPSRRLILRVLISLALFPALLLLQPGFSPALGLAGMGLVCMTFLYGWSWRQRLTIGTLAFLVFAVSAVLTTLALSAWLSVTPGEIFRGMGIILGGELSPDARSMIVTMMDFKGTFNFGLKHSLFAAPLWYSLDLNDLSYYVVGYDLFKGGTNALILAFCLTAVLCFRGWKQKTSFEKYTALLCVGGLVLLCAAPYAYANLETQQERFDLLSALFPFFALQISFKAWRTVKNAWFMALSAAILVSGVKVQLTRSSEYSSWQQMQRILPRGSFKTYVFAESDVRTQNESISLALLGAMPIRVIENPQIAPGAGWSRARYRVPRASLVSENLEGAYISDAARAQLEQR